MKPLLCLLTFALVVAASGCADSADQNNTAAESSSASPEQASTVKSETVVSAAGDSFNCEEDFAKDAALADRLNAEQAKQEKADDGPATKSDPAIKSAADKATALPEDGSIPATEATN